jgi:hypothetical protein
VNWGELYAHLLTCFPGWTYEYIDDHMTIPRVLEINAYQAKCPPLHIMVAGYLGIGSKSSKPSETDENGQSLFDLMPRA